MLLRVLLYCGLSALLFAIAATGSLSPRALGWSFVQGFLIAAAFFPVVRWSAATSKKLFAIIWPVLMLVGVVTLASEAAIFIETPLRQFVAGYWRLAFAYTALAVALAYLPFRLDLYAAEASVPAARSAAKSVLAVLAAGIVYLVLYYVFGGIFYRAFTQPYYTHQVAGTATLKQGEAVARSLGIWFPLIQIARGIVITLAVLPIIRMLRLRRASTAVIVGLVLWVVGGLAPLVVPNPTMAGLLRFYHTLEIFTQNFTLGVIATMLLRGKGAAAIGSSRRTDASAAGQ